MIIFLLLWVLISYVLCLLLIYIPTNFYMKIYPKSRNIKLITSVLLLVFVTPALFLSGLVIGFLDGIQKASGSVLDLAKTIRNEYKND